MQLLKFAVLTLFLIGLPAVGKGVELNQLSLGNGVDVTVPVPSGFVPLGESAPNFRKFTQNRMHGFLLIEYYLSRSDLRDVIGGHSKIRKRTLSIAMPEGMVLRNFSETDFEAAAEDIRLNYGKSISRAETVQNGLLRHRDDGAASASITGGKSLGVFLDIHDAIGTAAITTTNADGREVQRIGASVTMRVRNRVISVAASSVVHNKADVDWAEHVVTQWSKDILKVNTI